MAEEFDFGSRVPCITPLETATDPMEIEAEIAVAQAMRSPVGIQLTSTPNLAPKRWAELVGPDVGMAYVLRSPEIEGDLLGPKTCAADDAPEFWCSPETLGGHGVPHLGCRRRRSISMPAWIVQPSL